MEYKINNFLFLNYSNATMSMFVKAAAAAVAAAAMSMFVNAMYCIYYIGNKFTNRLFFQINIKREKEPKTFNSNGSAIIFFSKIVEIFSKSIP